MLQPSDIIFVAADNITENEAKVIAAHDMDVIDLAAVKRDPAAAVQTVADWARGYDHLLIHLDVDVLNFLDFPIAENTRRQAGLTFDELSELAGLVRLPNWSALTIAQLNPNHAPVETESFRRLDQMLVHALKTPTPQ